VAQANLKTSKV